MRRLKLNKYGNYFGEWPDVLSLDELLRIGRATDLRLMEFDTSEPGYRSWSGMVTFRGWQCHFRASACEAWSRFAMSKGGAMSHLCIGFDADGHCPGRVGRDRDDAMRRWLLADLEFSKRVREWSAKQKDARTPGVLRAHDERIAEKVREWTRMN